jgi:hypothetical protein
MGADAFSETGDPLTRSERSEARAKKCLVARDEPLGMKEKASASRDGVHVRI